MSELLLQIRAQIDRCDTYFVYQRRPAIDDCHDIFKIVTDQKIATPTIVKRYQLCSDEYRSGN